jgi:hypothetical protein
VHRKCYSHGRDSAVGSAIVTLCYLLARSQGKTMFWNHFLRREAFPAILHFISHPCALRTVPGTYISLDRKGGMLCHGSIGWSFSMARPLATPPSSELSQAVHFPPHPPHDMLSGGIR